MIDAFIVNNKPRFILDHYLTQMLKLKVFAGPGWVLFYHNISVHPDLLNIIYNVEARCLQEWTITVSLIPKGKQSVILSYTLRRTGERGEKAVCAILCNAVWTSQLIK